MSIEMGATVVHKVNRLRGVVTAHIAYQTGPDRYRVSRTTASCSRLWESWWDEGELDVQDDEIAALPNEVSYANALDFGLNEPVRDRVTGFWGRIYAICTYASGGVQVEVMTEVDDDGHWVREWLSAARLEPMYMTAAD